METKSQAMQPPSDDTPVPFPLTAVDKAQLALTDDQFEPHTWDDLKQIIGGHSFIPCLGLLFPDFG
jgi:hypothetical protein